MSVGGRGALRERVDAFNRGDLDWLLEHIDEDFVFDWSRSRGPLAAVYRGRAGLTEFCREQWETFETFHMEALEYIDCGRFVVVPNKVSARGRNGIEVSAEANQVFTLEPTGGCRGWRCIRSWRRRWRQPSPSVG